jgi:hypothetical protein
MTLAIASRTGFLYPIHKFTPGLAIGTLSPIVLAITILAHYRFGLAADLCGDFRTCALLQLPRTDCTALPQGATTLRRDNSDDERQLFAGPYGLALRRATASARDRDFVSSLGAEQVIEYRKSRFEKSVSRLGVVFDTVGGDTLERS